MWDTGEEGEREEGSGGGGVGGGPRGKQQGSADDRV